MNSPATSQPIPAGRHPDTCLQAPGAEGNIARHHDRPVRQPGLGAWISGKWTAARRRLSSPADVQWSLQLLQALEWRAFDELAAGFFGHLGFRSMVPPGGSHVGGVDIWLYQEESARRMGAVLCLTGPGRIAGATAVQALAEILAADGVRHGVVISTGHFSREAEVYAADRSIELIDGEDFLRKIQSLSEETQRRLMREATRGDYRTPSCPQCGSRMEARVFSSGRVWCCRTFPRCRGKLNDPHGI